MPDNIGMLFRRNLVMFGPREVLLTSEEPVVQQFLQGRRIGPIGMSEEKDSAQMEAEEAELKKKGGSTEAEESFIDPQLDPTEGIGERKAVQRRKDRVMQVLHTLPEKAQTAILEQLHRRRTRSATGSRLDQDRTELIEITRDRPAGGRRPVRPPRDGRHGSTERGRRARRGPRTRTATPRPARPPPPRPRATTTSSACPVDDHAGGTVVLPQGGEHTKDEQSSEEPRVQRPPRSQRPPRTLNETAPTDEIAGTDDRPGDLPASAGRFRRVLHRMAR